jgi:uncharacterized protein with HEPN domain
MARDLSAYLQDVIEACNSIEDVMSYVSLEGYRNKCAVRSATEREFIIIGETLIRIWTLDETLFGSISNSRAIVDFRNLLAHHYGAVDGPPRVRKDVPLRMAFMRRTGCRGQPGPGSSSWHSRSS